MRDDPKLLLVYLGKLLSKESLANHCRAAKSSIWELSAPAMFQHLKISIGLELPFLFVSYGSKLLGNVDSRGPARVELTQSTLLT